MKKYRKGLIQSRQYTEKMNQEWGIRRKKRRDGKSGGEILR